MRARPRPPAGIGAPPQLPAPWRVGPRSPPELMPPRSATRSVSKPPPPPSLLETPPPPPPNMPP